MRVAGQACGHRGRVAALSLVPLVGLFAWTLLWYLLRGGDAAAMLARPFAAPAAWLARTIDQPPDPLLGLAGGAALLLTGGLVAALLAPRTTPVFGDARFARSAELRANGLLADSGLLLGRHGPIAPRYVRHDGPHHLLLCAPTRSGKGVGVVTPNLLTWPGSVVVLDIKDESHSLTSGYRAAHGQRVFRFAPGDPEVCTARYNPLDAVRRTARDRVADLQGVAHLLVTDGGDGGMWAQEARSLFVGLCLYILATPSLPLTLGQVLRLLQSNDPLPDVVRKMLADAGARLDPAGIDMLASFATKAPKEASGVRSTLTGSLALWSDPRVDAATSNSDFDLAMLRCVPTTIYVSVSLDQLDRCAPLIALLFQQLVGVLTRQMPGPDEPLPLLLLVDEFASLGRMDVLVDRMPFLAGFNVRLVLVVQGLAQLDRLYGASGRELILQNAGLQLFFATNDVQTSDYVTGRLGTYTEAQRTRSRSTPLMGGGHGSVTTGQSLHARPLLNADEVRRLDRRQGILFVEGCRPVRLTKIVAYADRRFAARRSPAPVTPPIDVPRHLPFRLVARTRTGAQQALTAAPEVVEATELAEVDDMSGAPGTS